MTPGSRRAPSPAARDTLCRAETPARNWQAQLLFVWQEMTEIRHGLGGKRRSILRCGAMSAGSGLSGSRHPLIATPSRSA
jgi:hypothetical protein